MVTHETTDDALARIDAQVRAAEAEMLRAQEFHTTLTAIRGCGASSGVRAEVDAQGVLLGVDFAVSGHSPRGEELAREVMAAVRAAQADALRQVETHAQRVWGSDPLGPRIVAEVAQRLGLEADVTVGSGR